MIKFTKEEKTLLLFIVAAFFLGLALLHYKKSNPAPFEFIEVKEKSSERININTAQEADLIKIKGVGPVLAGRVIEYRKKQGPFKYPEDIKNVSGIGEKTFEKIRDAITVE